MISKQLTYLKRPSFHRLINPVLDGEMSDLTLSGGRGSLKSSFSAMIIIWGMMEDFYLRNEVTHAIGIRKVKATLAESVYNQFKWAIYMLDVDHLWKCTISPMKIRFLPSGQQIIFRGVDEPTKIKSINFPKGWLKYIWMEEYDQYSGPREVRIVCQSLRRGGKSLCIRSYNPPVNSDHWANLEAIEEPELGEIKHHSTWETVPPEWLGQDFIREALKLEKKNFIAYQNEYLGVVTGEGGNIFNNVKLITLADEEVDLFDFPRQGLDFGLMADPSCFEQLGYIRKKQSIWLLKEIYGYGIKTRDLSEKIHKIYNPNIIIKGDSAEQRAIDTMSTEYNLYITACKKGPDSVRHGIKWLRDLDNIFIDRKRNPYAYQEFSSYTHEKTKDGKFKNDYPDKDNHCISQDTKVITSKGIEYISNLNKGEILSWNINKNIPEYKEYYDCRKTGKQKIYRIKTSNGKIIKCTDYHPILTDSGYKTIKEIKKGDKIIDISNSILSVIDIVNKFVAVEDVEIKECGEIEVWNMEVNDNHNFVLDNG